jgi:hypothetical protein
MMVCLRLLAMDAQVNGMVTIGLLFIYYYWTVVVAVTAHAMHGVCVLLAYGPYLLWM